MNEETNLPGGGRPGLWCIGSAVLDEATGCVTVAGESHDLDHSSHELLRHLLRNPGKVALKDDLLHIGWPGRVVSENSLTKSIRRLRQALNDPEGKVLCTVHGYGYRLVARVEYVAQPDWVPAPGDHPATAGFPDEASRPAVAATAPAYKRRRRLVTLSAVMLALAMIVLGTHWRAPEISAEAGPPATRTPPSIAVLPFKDLSPGKDQDYMAEGITEELTNRLAQLSRIRVIGRSSASSLEGKDLDAAALGKLLRVSHLLEGSIRTSGQRIRVTAHLVRTSDSGEVWSQTFDRDLGDVLALQDEIATAVVAQLNQQLVGAAVRPRKVDPRAYALVLKERQLFRLSLPYDGRQGQYVKEALRIDPNDADAWSVLAAVYLNEILEKRRPREQGLKLVRETLGKAIALEPDNVIAYSHLISIALHFEDNPREAARLAEKALSMHPRDLRVLWMAGFVADALGRSEEAIETLKYVNEQDPLDAGSQYSLGYYYLFDHSWDKALESYRAALALSPEANYVNGSIGNVLLHKGQPERALAAYKLVKDEPDRLSGLLMANHALGNSAESKRALNTLIEKYGSETDDGGRAYDIACTLAMIGETDRAFDWLDKVPSNLPATTIIMRIHKDADLLSLHSDPRWLPMLRKHGRAPEQLAALKAIKFDFKVPSN